MKKLITLFGLLTGLTANAQLSATTNQFIPQENYGINYGFENGKAGHVASAGTFAITSTAANVARGQFAASMDFSATSQTLTLASRTIPSGLFGNNCIAEAMVKGGDANITMQVYDGSNVVVSQALSTYATYTKVSIPFVCPSSGTLAIRFLSSADAAIFYADDAFWGSNYRVGTVAQVEDLGGVSIALGATGSSSISSTFPTFTTFNQTNWTARRTNKGRCANPTTAGDLGCLFAYAGPGKYKIDVAANISAGTANGCYIRVKETVSGTTSTPNFAYGTQEGFPGSHFITLTTGVSNANLVIEAARDASTTCNADLTNYAFEMSVIKVPSQSETVYAPNMQAAMGYSEWNSDAFTPITNTAAAWTTFNGSGIDSNRTNGGSCANSGTANDLACRIAKLPGGRYLVQAVGGQFDSHDSTSCSFAIYDGTNRKGNTGSHASSSSVGIFTIGSSVGAIFDYTSEQTNIEFKIQSYATSGSNGCRVRPSNITGLSGTKGLTLMVIPLTQSVPMPVVLNSVQSTYAGQMRMETAFITNNGSNCVVSEEYGDWIASPTRGGTGNCAIPFNAAFSQNPHCVGSIYQAVGMNLRIQAISTSSVTIETFNSGGANTDQNYQLICIGPK